MTIRVMIVEDSTVVREFLQHVIGQDRRLEVVAATDSAEEALRLMERVSPDVVSMDIRLPGMNGLEATERIMRDRPTPIVVVAASVHTEDLRISMNALRRGALAIVEKPVGTTHRDYQDLAKRLCDQLVMMSQVKVVRQRMKRTLAQQRDERPDICPRSGWPTVPILGPCQMVGIVASTGGPAALQRLLSGLDPRFAVPIAIVQHMTDSFHAGFVAWLASLCRLPVRVPRMGEEPAPGTIYVAPSSRHLRLERDRWQLTAGRPVSSQRPSGTVLFQSMAEALGPEAVGILLTGMGTDGADGLLAIRQAGGFTIAEDESTAVVNGMPEVARRIGAARVSLPLDAIAAAVKKLALARQEVHS
jgi:two-component system, chemotaxis family, protein-glutamate methylesterase/glutaminase